MDGWCLLTFGGGGQGGRRRRSAHGQRTEGPRSPEHNRGHRRRGGCPENKGSAVVTMKDGEENCDPICHTHSGVIVRLDSAYFVMQRRGCNADSSKVWVYVCVCLMSPEHHSLKNRNKKLCLRKPGTSKHIVGYKVHLVKINTASEI